VPADHHRLARPFGHHLETVGSQCLHHAGSGTGQDLGPGREVAGQDLGGGHGAGEQLFGGGPDADLVQPAQVLVDGEARVVGQEANRQTGVPHPGHGSGGTREPDARQPDHTVEVTENNAVVHRV
jgi:hypothetical protein